MAKSLRTLRYTALDDAIWADADAYQVMRGRRRVALLMRRSACRWRSLLRTLRCTAFGGAVWVAAVA